MNTFEDFLRDALDHGHTQIKLMPRIDENGGILFYATGQCGSSSCADFNGAVVGDDMINMEQPEEPEVFTDGVAPGFPPPMTDAELAEASVEDIGAVLDAEELAHFDTNPVEDEKPDAE